MANSDNPARGVSFEGAVQRFFLQQDIRLELNYSVDVGAGSIQKGRRFDLGCLAPATLVECKCHSWTEGGNSPSAKLSVWNEAMFYFLVAPPIYRKILAVLGSIRRNESRADHYVRRFAHLVPLGVEIWEIDAAGESGRAVFTGR